MNLPAEQAANPFGQAQAPAVTNAQAVAEQERAIQEVQASLVIAKKFPRNPIEAMDRILNACTRPGLAEGALYSYQRGGSEITGPSIRLAETLAQEWGNMQFGIRELSSANGASTVEAFAWDVETNTRQVKTFQVPHERHTRRGVTRLTDPRDIYELIANQGARRLRACILGVIPGDVTEQAVKQCEITQTSTVEVTPETIKAMLDNFQERYNINQELIEKRLGRRAESINAPQMLSLRKIFASLKDGMSKPSDWFDIEVADEASGVQTSDLDLTQGKAEQQEEPPAKEAPAKKAPAKKRGGKKAEEPPAGEGSGELTYAIVADGIHKAESVEALENGVQPLLNAFLDAGDNDEKFGGELGTLYNKRHKELQAAADNDPANQ